MKADTPACSFDFRTHMSLVASSWHSFDVLPS
jgi:hypothetical protein